MNHVAIVNVKIVMLVDVLAASRKDSGKAMAQAGQTVGECPGQPYLNTRAVRKVCKHACRRFWEGRQPNRAGRPATCQGSSTHACTRVIARADLATECRPQQQVRVQGLEPQCRISLVEPMQVGTAIRMATSVKVRMMPHTAKTEAWKKAMQLREILQNALCSARYKRWCGTRLPSMNSRASRWYMRKHPYYGSREHCVTAYAQYYVDCCKTQFNHAMQS